MARQKTNKTAKKRIRLSNPRGNRKPKLRYKQSHQGHLKTKRSTRSKRRQLSNAIVSPINEKKIIRKVINL
jgi:ribosomal protein L35